MAEVVLGLGMSHTPQMSLPAEHWPAYASRDRDNPSLIFRQRRWDFDDLVAERAGEGLAGALDEAAFSERYERVQRGVAQLESALSAARPDVVVVVGDDHHELFSADSMPTLAVYWGKEIEAIPPEQVFPAVAPAAWALFGERRETYPCDPALGEHLIASLNGLSFDVAQLRSQPEGVSVGHTFIAVRTRLMRSRDVPLPIVPVIMNTYFPPNVPTPQRAWEFGAALRRAIESFPQDLRVAVVASGGLSHFVVDEDVDRALLEVLRTGDRSLVERLDPRDFVSGTSESLCWLAVGGACQQLDFELVEYVPGYRTPAGTGCAMAMARWDG